MSPRLPSSPSGPATDADDRTSGRDRPPNRARPSRRRLLAALGATATAGTTALAGCAGAGGGSIRDDYPEGVLVDAGWPSPSRDDANTAYAPDGTAPDGTVDIEYPFGAPPAPPTVAAGVVLVPGRTMRAVDPGTGETRWSRPYGSWTAPAVRDGVVYVPGATGDDGSAETGSESDEGVAGAKDAEDADGTGSLVGLDVRSGEEAWRVSLPGRPTGPVAFGNPPDQLYVPIAGGRVCGASIDPPGHRWTAGVFGEVAAPLAANLAQLFVATSTGELYSFGRDGTPAWRRALHARLSAPPVAGDRRVYVGTKAGEVLALDRTDGSLAWRFEGNGFVEDPVAFDGRRLYAAAGDLVALRADTGEATWRYEAPGGIGSGPIVVDGTVFVGAEQSRTEMGHGADDGSLVALDADGGGFASGPRRWQLPVGDFVGHGLSYADGRLFVPTLSTDGTYTLVAVR
jgi:outer membrane protein assembly factor BamB